MNDKSFKQRVDDALPGVRLTDAQRTRIRYAAATAETAPLNEKPRPRRRMARRVLATAAVACLAVVFSLGVAATVFPGFEWFLQRMGEDLRDKVQPIELNSSSQGVTMEVLAAVADQDMAVVYLSLRGDTAARIDETTELLDLSVGDIGHAFAPQVDYDPETGTAIYRMEIHGFGRPSPGEGPDQGLLGEDIPLTLNSMLLGTQWREPADTGLSVGDILAANPEPETFLAGTAENVNGTGPVASGYGISYGDDPAVADALAARFDSGTLPFLALDSAPMETNENSWVDITAAGVVDGMLHLQFRPATEAAAYAHTSLELWWPGLEYEDGYLYNGLTVGSFNLGKARIEGDRDYYEAYELVLELPEDVPPEDIRVMVGGHTCEARLAGSWAVNFTVEEDAPTLSTKVNIASEGWRIHTVTVSSIGMQLDGTENADSMGSTGPTDHAVYLKDGTQVNSYSLSSFSGDDGKMGMRENFARPIDITQVDKVVIDGQEVFFNQ